MANIVDGNILDAGERYLCHQCNCVSSGAAGLAAVVFRKYSWADVYSGRGPAYVPGPGESMGDILIRGDGTGRRFVAALLAQYYPGAPRFPEGARDGYAARLSAFSKCLDRLAAIDGLGSVAFPHGIGCGLAGGHWPLYLAAIERFAEQAKVPVTIYRLEQNTP